MKDGEWVVIMKRYPRPALGLHARNWSNLLFAFMMILNNSPRLFGSWYECCRSVSVGVSVVYSTRSGLVLDCTSTVYQALQSMSNPRLHDLLLETIIT